MASSSRLALVLVFTISCFQSCHAARRNTLKPGDTLNSSSSLVSKTGKFTLGFFENGNSKTSYLAIYYINSGNSINYAWIANRKTPILYPTGVLTLDKNNTLKVTQNGGDPLLLYSASESSTNNTSVVATLLDSGNFILQQVNSDGSTKRVLWQSFDHPGNTLLPGMKLGVDHKNGHIWSLSSWLSLYNAEPGAFTLDWDPSEHQLKIRQRGKVCWSSGVFTDGRFKFVLPDDDSKKMRYNFTIVSNENEDYFTYTAVDDQSDGSQWVLNVLGRLRDFDINVDIARADYCYGYNSDGGCERWEQPGCRHVGDRFELQQGYFQAITSSASFTSNSNTSQGYSDCKATCWNYCGCLGFNYRFSNQTGCQFWTGNWKFIEDLTDDDSRIFVYTTKPTPTINEYEWRWIGTGIAVALLVIMFFILSYLLRRRKFLLSGENRKKIQNELLNLMTSNRPTDVNVVQNDGKMVHHDLSVFSYASIMAATCNFSKENKLGEGGFGPVYKGKLVTGKEIAVKRLSECSGQGTLEFKNELILIYELQHTNLVQLFGFCIHGDERMLIYEYMPNKSLDYFLFDSTRALLLDWKTRFSIIEGITQGVLYLHKYSRMQVIHRDLKASNILLDENMNPKISDFGMARIFTHNEREAKTKTKRIVGTYGYMSPEYAMGGIFSIKSDVYSFGVLMLEIISGRRNTSFYDDDRVVNTVGYAWELWKDGAGLAFKDPTLGDSCNGDQLLRCIHVGLLCVEENGADRPTMLEVISMLTNESMSLRAPTKPAFCVERKGLKTGTVGKGSETMSINTMFNSDYDAR
ncbi:G-type lectin S-receptor-like serine/threonine-protein kinase CES101 [Rosa sericea]